MLRHRHVAEISKFWKISSSVDGCYIYLLCRQLDNAPIARRFVVLEMWNRRSCNALAQRNAHARFADDGKLTSPIDASLWRLAMQPFFAARATGVIGRSVHAYIRSPRRLVWEWFWYTLL